MIVQSLRVARDELESRTGWRSEPQGLCRGDVCVSLAGSGGSELDLSAVADALGRPLVADEPHGLWALGPETGRALNTAVAPEIELPDWKGNPFRLGSLRGRKILLVAWASW